MATIAEIEARLEALKKARGSGALRVSYAGQSVEYRSIDELNKAIGAIEQELAQASGVSIVRRFSFISDKGL